MKNDRNQLLSSQIPKFQVWLDENGIIWRKPKGEYQVLQIKMVNAWAAICTNAQGVISSPPCLRGMIARFKKGLPFTGKSERVESSKIPYEALEDLSVLRDDFAMAALQGMLSGDINWHGQELEAADRAYFFADAMIARRSK